MAKKKKKERRETAERKPIDKRKLYGNILRLLCLVAATMAVFFSYRLLLELFMEYSLYILIAYTGVATVLILWYLIYNRGFSRKGVTEDMLPADWTPEQKTAFIEDGAYRLRRSRPLLIACFAFVFTFLIDVFELTVLPVILGFFGKG